MIPLVLNQSCYLGFDEALNFENSSAHQVSFLVPANS